MAAAAGVSEGRPPARLEDCPCVVLGAAHTDEVVFDASPANGLQDEDDRKLAINIAMIGSYVHVGESDSTGWKIEAHPTDPKLFMVIVEFPPRTIMSIRQFSLVQDVNWTRIKDVWCQPEEDACLMGVTVWRSSEAIVTTVDDLVMLRRRVEIGTSDAAQVKPPPRKRTRARR